MPGEVIANIYEKYRNRLLENNVRVFLQARRQVNKGIKNTIEKIQPCSLALIMELLLQLQK